MINTSVENINFISKIDKKIQNNDINYNNTSLEFFIYLFDINQNNFKEVLRNINNVLHNSNFTILEKNGDLVKRDFRKILFFDQNNKSFFNKIQKEKTISYLNYYQYFYYKNVKTHLSSLMAKSLDEIDDDYYEKVIKNVGECLKGM